ncbi:MAG: YggT family protein [Proteobacteria bacterium]|nr:YggT family protein [Pseudomonadota bacterium]
MARLFDFINYLVSLYIYIVVAGVIMSWLIGFNVINLYNPMVRTVWDAINALTEPFLRPIRGFINRVLPDLRGIDISPMVLILACIFLQHVIIGNLRDAFL